MEAVDLFYLNVSKTDVYYDLLLPPSSFHLTSYLLQNFGS